MTLGELTGCSEIASVEIAQRETLRILGRIENILMTIARTQQEMMNRMYTPNNERRIR